VRNDKAQTFCSNVPLRSLSRHALTIIMFWSALCQKQRCCVKLRDAVSKGAGRGAGLSFGTEVRVTVVSASTPKVK
jgi:hypothetical protein